MTLEAANEAPTFGEYLDVYEHTTAYDVMFEFRRLVEARRQFAVIFEDGVWTIASPKIGHRSPATPQPTDPNSIALLAKAA